MKKRNVTLPDGSNLELEYSEQFNDKVRQYFELGPHDEPTDEHVRNFIFRTCKLALDKAEEEMRRDGTWD
jgi:hypothetical protein